MKIFKIKFFIIFILFFVFLLNNVFAEKIIYPNETPIHIMPENISPESSININKELIDILKQNPEHLNGIDINETQKNNQNILNNKDFYIYFLFFILILFLIFIIFIKTKQQKIKK